MSKLVRETTAGRSLSAYVILNRRGQHVATVNAHYSNNGAVTVDVWNIGDGPCARSMATAEKTGRISAAKLAATIARAPDYYKTDGDRRDWAAYELFGLQQGRASGYGYDKFTAALSGMIIDGHSIADHCGAVPESEKARARIMRAYEKDGDLEKARAKAERIGATFANWRDGRWISIHFRAGLDRLAAMGYRVIQAI